jgi:transposase
MAAIVSPYPLNVYHQQSYFNSKLRSTYRPPYIPNNYYKPKPQKPQKQQKQQQQPRTPTPTPTKTTEPADSNVQQLRSRREPRIHRQVIILPTPEPIYRQVRHRLPTPERQVIQRTVIHKSNGDVVVQQERHRKRTRSQSRSKTTTQPGSPRIQQVNND